jgi:hypothetical protein
VDCPNDTPIRLWLQDKGYQMSKQDRWFSNPTQVFWTCKALIEGRVISHEIEIAEVKGWRLGAIIHLLRSKYHWPIDVEYRGPECVAYYRLRPETDITRLTYPPSAIALAGGAS